MSRIDTGVRSTRARLVIISLTYRPAPNSRHKRRNAVLVIPAMGARTTGTSSSSGPILNPAAASPGAPECAPAAVRLVASSTVTRQFSQSLRPTTSPPGSAADGWRRWNAPAVLLPGRLALLPRHRDHDRDDCHNHDEQVEQHSYRSTESQRDIRLIPNEQAPGADEVGVHRLGG